MILLDTNVLSELMKGSPSQRVLDWINHLPPADLWVSAISQAESCWASRYCHPASGKTR